jgi:hypothetical protein
VAVACDDSMHAATDRWRAAAAASPLVEPACALVGRAHGLGAIVVVPQLDVEYALELPSIEDEHPIEARSPYAAGAALDMRVRVWRRPDRRRDDLHTLT